MKLTKIILILLVFYSCNKCDDCNEIETDINSKKFETYIITNKSNHFIEIFSFDTNSKKKNNTLYGLHYNDSITIKKDIYLGLSSVSCDDILIKNLIIEFDQKKYTFLKNQSCIDFFTKLDTTQQKSFHNRFNYLPINSTTYKYTFTEKDYLLADTIIN